MAKKTMGKSTKSTASSWWEERQRILAGLKETTPIKAKPKRNKTKKAAKPKKSKKIKKASKKVTKTRRTSKSKRRTKK